MAVAFALRFGFFMGSAWGQGTDLEQPVRVDAEIGWDSVVKVGRRIPIRVWLDYPAGSEFSGTIRIAGHGQGYPYLVNGQSVHLAELVLSPPARKRVDFTVPYLDSWRREVPIELTSPHLRLVERIIVRRSPRILLAGNGRLIVVAGRERIVPAALLNHCQEVYQERQDEVRTVAVGIEARGLSDRWADYDAVDLLVLQGFGDARLAPRVAEAIAKWTVSGGRLLITGGVDPLLIEKSGIWSLLPVTPSRNLGTREFAEPQPAFKSDSAIHRSFTFRDFELRKDVDADIWPAFTGGPLVVEQRVGGGWIGYTPLVTESPPLATTAAGRRFWEQLLVRALATETSALRLSFAAPSDSTYRGRRAPDAQRIPLGALALYLGCYFLFVGPINYLFLRRRKRFELVWITVPCLSVAFLFIAYAGGRLLWGTRMMLRELALIEVFPPVNADAAESPVRYVSRLRVTSPSKSQYDVWLGDEIVPVAAYLPNNPDALRLSGFEIFQDPGTLLRRVKFNMWSSRCIYTENVMDVSGGIRGTAFLDGGQIRGSIECDLPVRFEETGIYLWGLRQTDLPFRPGEKTYSYEFAAPGPDWESAYSTSFHGSIRGQDYTSEQAFHQAVYYLESSFQLYARQQSYFIGVCSQPIQSIKVDGKAVEGDRYAVYLVEIPILGVERESEIPPFMWQEVPRDEGNIVDISYDRCLIEPGQVGWEFYAPSFIDMARLVRLEIKFSSQLVAPPNRLDILDPRSGQWRNLLSVGSVETGKVTIQFRDGPQGIDAFMDPVHRKITIRASIQAKMDVPRLSYRRYTTQPGTADSHGLIQILLRGVGTPSAGSDETSVAERTEGAN